MEEYSQPALARLLPLLHHTSRCLLATLDGPAPGGLLVCGPPGSGAPATNPCRCRANCNTVMLLPKIQSRALEPLMAHTVCAKQTLATRRPAQEARVARGNSMLTRPVRCREERPGRGCGARLEPRRDVPHACGLDQVWGDRDRDPWQSQGSPTTPGEYLCSMLLTGLPPFSRPCSGSRP